MALTAAVVLVAAPVQAQAGADSGAAPADSNKASVPTPPWRGKVRYGGGPSVGMPLSDYTGKAPPSQWCLQATRRAPGDLGGMGPTWTDVSRSWLKRVLSDTTEWGDGWRRVLGGAPALAEGDSIIQVADEATCHEIAAILNRDLLGWVVGPPPVVVLRVRDYLIAYPSNARYGEFGLAAGMSVEHDIRGVALW